MKKHRVTVTLTEDVLNCLQSTSERFGFTLGSCIAYYVLHQFDGRKTPTSQKEIQKVSPEKPEFEIDEEATEAYRKKIANEPWPEGYVPDSTNAIDPFTADPKVVRKAIRKYD